MAGPGIAGPGIAGPGIAGPGIAGPGIRGHWPPDGVPSGGVAPGHGTPAHWPSGQGASGRETPSAGTWVFGPAAARSGGAAGSGAPARARCRPASPVEILAPAAASSRPAAAASGRACGFRCSKASMTWHSGPADRGRGASSLAMAARIAMELPRLSKGPRPSTAAYRVAPSDHRSEAGVARSPRMRSGAVNPGVPITIPAWVRPLSPSRVAMPKSVSTARLSGPSSTLLGFTSRCRMPAACAQASAPSTRMPRSAA